MNELTLDLDRLIYSSLDRHCERLGYPDVNAMIVDAIKATLRPGRQLLEPQAIALQHYTDDELSGAGIYLIANLKARRYYVGSTVTIITRVNAHLSQLRHNKHCNKRMQADWNAQGGEGFSPAVIELRPSDTVPQLRARETAWIYRYHKAYTEERVYNVHSSASAR